MQFFSCSVLLTERGKVYTFGWGADGQTALAHYKNESQPSLVKGDLAGQHIIKVACIADCVLALSGKRFINDPIRKFIFSHVFFHFFFFFLLFI